MKILGIETATRIGSVALIDESTLIAEYRLSLQLRHAEKLLPLIDTLLKETGISLADLHAIAVSIGPGSFTGLRVGLAAAKGLALARRLPLLPVPTLEALAAPFRYAQSVIAPIMISRKEEVYFSLFSTEGDGLRRLHPDSVSPLEEALDKIHSEAQRQQQKEVLFVGEGAVLFRDRILKQATFGNTGAVASSLSLQSPLASFVAELGLLQMLHGKEKSPDEVVPVYLSSFKPNVPASTQSE